MRLGGMKCFPGDEEEFVGDLPAINVNRDEYS